MLRLATCAAVVAATWFAATALSGLLSGPRGRRGAEVPPGRVEAPVSPGPSLTASGLGGSWQLADPSVRVELLSASEKQVNEKVRAIPAAFPHRPRSGHGGEVIGLVKDLGASSALHLGRRTYVLDRPGLKALVITEGEGTEETMLVGRLALPAPGQRWLLVETALPSSRDSRGPFPAALLPLPEGSRWLAVRHDSHGRPIGALGLAARAVDLPRMWQQRGWAVETLENQDGPDPVFLCRRGEAAFQVWSSPDSDPGLRGLVVIRVPSDRRNP
jgi:hypothetical protein